MLSSYMTQEFANQLIALNLNPAKMDTLMRKAILDVTASGELTMRFDPDTTMRISVDRSVRLSNTKTGISFAISARPSYVALVHPLLRLEQQGHRIEIETKDWLNRHPTLYNRHAKFSSRGITFCTGAHLQTNFAYILDEAGPRSTHDKFRLLSRSDITLPAYATGSRFGQECFNEAFMLGNRGNYQELENGTDKWLINGVHVACTPIGEFSISVAGNCVQTWLTPQNSGNICIRNNFFHCTASTGPQAHFFVKQDDKRIHHNGQLFSVRYAGYSEALDDTNKLTLL